MHHPLTPRKPGSPPPSPPTVEEAVPTWRRHLSKEQREALARDEAADSDRAQQHGSTEIADLRDAITRRAKLNPNNPEILELRKQLSDAYARAFPGTQEL